MAVEAPEAPAQEAAVTPVREIFDNAFKSSATTRSDFARVQASAPEPEATPQEPAAESKPEPTPEAATETAQPEAAPEPEVDDSPATDEKGRYKWGELKKEVKTLKAQKTEWETKLKEASQSVQELAQTKEQIQSLQKQIEAANQELFVHRVEATPEWKSTVADPLNEVFNGIDTLAQMSKIDSDKLYEAVNAIAKGADYGPLRSLLEGVDGDAATDIKLEARDLAKNLVAVQKRAQDLKANSKEAYESSMKNQKELTERQQQQRTEEYRKASAAIGEKFKEKLSSLLPEEVQSKLDYAGIGMDAQNIDAWSADTKVFAGFAASAVLPLLETVESQAKQLKEAREQLAKLRGNSPKANGGTSPSAPETTPKKTPSELAKTSYKDFARESMIRLTGSR